MEEIVFYPMFNEPDYLISKCGKIKKTTYVTARGRKIITKEASFSISKQGYVSFNICNGSIALKRLVHRYVALTFIPNPASYPEVNHINGIKSDNRVENLEWCTSKQNKQHSIKMGIFAINEKSGKAKINKEKALQIKQELANGETIKNTSIKLCVSIHIVADIKINRTWKNIHLPLTESDKKQIN